MSLSGFPLLTSLLNAKTKTNVTAGNQAFDNQVWAVWPVNDGNSFAFVSQGPPSNVCANGDGGPLDSLDCSSVYSNSEVAQSAQVTSRHLRYHTSLLTRFGNSSSSDVKLVLQMAPARPNARSNRRMRVNVWLMTPRILQSSLMIVRLVSQIK